MIRRASAVWSGGLKDGNGAVSTHSGILKDTPYSFSTRFENSPGTNPEELVAAAHAGCFAMALSAQLGEAGLRPEQIRAEAVVTMEKGEGGWAVTRSHLEVVAKVPGASAEQFEKAAGNAKSGCPISKLLKTNITMNARLE
jgi:lipoyl-dependent peroxiredoxin